MRTILCLTLLALTVYGQKRFEPEYFINKYNLKLPDVTEEMLDVTELTHISDSWVYFYQGKSEMLDSVVRYLTIERFEPSKRIERYHYSADSVIVNMTAVSLIDGNTLSNWNTVFKENFNNQKAHNLKTNCFLHSKFDERGIKLLDVSKCPGEKDYGGQVFRLEKRDDYLESIPVNNGIVDSNNIRRYFIAPFDSIVADFLVEKNRKPVFFYLNTYNNNNLPVYKYHFDVFRASNPIVSFNYYSHDNAGQLQIVYTFSTINWENPKDGFELTNFTQNEYDTLGRKTRSTTKVKPDPKDKKQ